MQIGQLADRFGLNTTTIRYYESIGLLPEPDRSPSGYRRYAEADADRLAFICTARRLALTLDDIQRILSFREQGEAPCGHVRGLLRRQARDLDQRIFEMQRLREQLGELIDRGEDLPDDASTAYCQLIEHGTGEGG